MDVVLNPEQIATLEESLTYNGDYPNQKNFGMNFVSIEIIGTKYTEFPKFEIYAWEISQNLLDIDKEDYPYTPHFIEGSIIEDSSSAGSVVITASIIGNDIMIHNINHASFPGGSLYVFPKYLQKYEMKGHVYNEQLLKKNWVKAEEYFFGDVEDNSTTKNNESIKDEVELLDTPMDYRIFLSILKNSGYEYADVDTSQDEGNPTKFLSQEVKRIIVGDYLLGIVEYESEELMEYDASYISEDGSTFWIPGVSATHVEWISKPSFFKKDRIIVYFVGEDETIITFLSEILGKKFAGYP